MKYKWIISYKTGEGCQKYTCFNQKLPEGTISLIENSRIIIDIEKIMPKSALEKTP